VTTFSDNYLDSHRKHHIKAADRLLGNRHLHAERDAIYRAIARTLLAGLKRPLIVVDWSDADLRRRWLMIKAAVAVGGRAVSVYEKVYPMKRYNSPKTHREFLDTLKAILPDGCNPIMVTDAGFRGPWFKAVEAQGWDWVGRIRNRIKYYSEVQAGGDTRTPAQTRFASVGSKLRSSRLGAMGME
jgi:Transposase DDE domain